MHKVFHGKYNGIYRACAKVCTRPLLGVGGGRPLLRREGGMGKGPRGQGHGAFGITVGKILCIHFVNAQTVKAVQLQCIICSDTGSILEITF